MINVPDDSRDAHAEPLEMFMWGQPLGRPAEHSEAAPQQTRVKQAFHARVTRAAPRVLQPLRYSPSLRLRSPNQFWRLLPPSPMMIASQCGRTLTPPPEPNVGAFGEKLRKQRERRGLDLDAISNTTKISTRMLRALEDEHFDQLPGGIFNKGFVRAYARQVGLDEEEAVADYLTASRENQFQTRSVQPDFRAPAAKPAPAAPPDPGNNVLTDLPADNNKNDDSNDQNQQRRPEERRKKGRRDDDRRNEDRRNNDLRNNDRRNDDLRSEDHPYRTKEQKYPAGDPDPSADHSSASVPWGKLAFALLLVTLLLAVWNFRRHPTATSQPVPFSSQSPAPVSTPASAATAGTLPAEKSSPAPISTTPPPTHPQPAPSAAASATDSASKPPASPDANLPAAKPTAPAPAAKPATFTLLIRAEESTWISLIADGKPVAQENLIAPAHTSVRATREIVVKAGNAAGISFLLNGKEIPAQGNEGEVKTYVFDSTGLRPAPQ
jgi:cytoskeletal protein RodZ